MIELTFHFLDVAGGWVRPRYCSILRFGLFGRRRMRLCEWSEHRKGLLEHRHVFTRLFLDRLKNRRGQRAAKILGDFLAEFRLLTREPADREFEIAWHQHLH